MGNGAGTFSKSRYGAASGRESGERRWRVGVYLHKRLPSYVPCVHNPTRCPRIVARPLRRSGRERRLRAAPQDAGPGAARLAGRLSGRLEVTPQPPASQPTARLHASTPTRLRARA